MFKILYFKMKKFIIKKLKIKNFFIKKLHKNKSINIKKYFFLFI